MNPRYFTLRIVFTLFILGIFDLVCTAQPAAQYGDEFVNITISMDDTEKPILIKGMSDQNIIIDDINRNNIVAGSENTIIIKTNPVLIVKDVQILKNDRTLVKQASDVENKDGATTFQIDLSSVKAQNNCILHVIGADGVFTETNVHILTPEPTILGIEVICGWYDCTISGRDLSSIRSVKVANTIYDRVLKSSRYSRTLRSTLPFPSQPESIAPTLITMDDPLPNNPRTFKGPDAYLKTCNF